MNENQQKVIDYVRGKGQESLRWELDIKSLEELSQLNLNDLVVKTLRYTNIKNSYSTEDNSCQTRANRWRSSLDIWRHVKYFKPDITIFQVMNSLFEMQDHLAGHYCSEIRRRVFRVKGRGMLRSKDASDEYNLDFYQWENINKEENN